MVIFLRLSGFQKKNGQFGQDAQMNAGKFFRGE